MRASGKYVTVFVTCAHYDEASAIAQTLVGEKLVACVNILLHTESIYWWQGKVEKASEILMIAKTSARKIPQVIKRVKELHSYTVPEIIALPIVRGDRNYLKWIDQSIA